MMPIKPTKTNTASTASQGVAKTNSQKLQAKGLLKPKQPVTPNQGFTKPNSQQHLTEHLLKLMQVATPIQDVTKTNTANNTNPNGY
ncbi:hypothetical protein CHS0354_007874 [Potamilus streckersoni]|uniref:Uncharacterized protein n=1 Tax=Potamilus streckersoni TaxID=2493646 RepID=A0AAE0W489_9BIVA|nr:hypothetical protein CHS0354_007874 [Potamilus streckersoni]